MCFECVLLLHLHQLYYPAFIPLYSIETLFIVHQNLLSFRWFLLLFDSHYLQLNLGLKFDYIFEVWHLNNLKLIVLIEDLILDTILAIFWL